MQPLVSAMADLRRAFIAALKSLMRGKTFLMRVLLAFWSRPVPPGKHVVPQRTIDSLLREAEHLLLDSVVDYNSLRTFSAALKRQFRDRMANDPACMLPSYNSQLPLGSESGRYLSLDVGGSTLRVALVELHGCEGPGEEPTSRIVRMSSFHISPKVKALEGMAFFDWMAKRILETMQDSPPKHGSENPILMALAWSFPLQQVSLKGALLQGMGKGFLAADGLLGRDLGELISSACKKQGLNVELRAIVNDSSAALLAQAYLSPAATRFGLILGTGFNLAVHLPVNMIGRAKYGERPQEWFESATHVLVNTEMGMFGKGILPMTRWDRTLNSAHPKPEFQPLEQFVSGMYLGEVCRIALVEAIKTAGVCGGVVPPSLETPYSLDTETLSRIEGDKTASLDEATKYFNATHPSTNPATSTDMAVIRRLAGYVSQRSAALVAAVVYALWDLRREAESERLAQACDADEVKPKPGDFVKRAVVAFNGSVIEQYPGYLKNCQGYLDGLIATCDRQDVSFGDGETEVAIDLVMAKESSLLGAAVALACAEEGR